MSLMPPTMFSGAATAPAIRSPLENLLASWNAVLYGMLALRSVMTSVTFSPLRSAVMPSRSTLPPARQLVRISLVCPYRRCRGMTFPAASGLTGRRYLKAVHSGAATPLAPMAVS
ncbi:hypothetical protein PJL18_03963 [Paenarthrobacter nicotinovorans]|nr:hypothetical protein [Paenarthrobacter nicotinovorans]